MKLFVDALLIVLLFGYTSCTIAKRNKGEFHRSSSTVIIPSLEQKKIKLLTITKDMLINLSTIYIQ